MGEFSLIVMHCTNTRDIRPFGDRLCLRLEIQESTTTTRSSLDEINHDQHGVSIFPVMGHMIRYLYFCGPFGFFIDVCELCPFSPSNMWMFSGIQTLIQWHVTAASQSDRTGLLRDVC
jgi:hypothetical protein